jgi:aspartate/methionine/tyrosine aminotransferase
MQTAHRLEGIGEYYFSQKLREIEQMNQSGDPVISLGIGSPDLPPHPEVIRVLQEESARSNVHGYQSYKGIPVLRQAMADWYQHWYQVLLNPDTEILPLIGSKEGILHICMTYLNNGDQALIPDPGYPTYSSAVRLAGGIPVTYALKEENNWKPDWKEIEKQDLRKVKLFFVNYPHMPTGQLPDHKLFEEIVAFAKKHALLIIHDNPYSFILNDHPASILSIPDAKSCTLELNSLSKSQNMAGWRVGMLCGAASCIQDVLRFKSNMDSGMFLPVQLAAAKALSLGKEWYDSVNEIYRQRRILVYELLNKLKLGYSLSQGGLFVWARVPGNESLVGDDKAPYGAGGLLSDRILKDARVFITPGGIFGAQGNDYIRISLCAPEEKIKQCIQRIHSLFC